MREVRRVARLLQGFPCRLVDLTHLDAGLCGLECGGLRGVDVVPDLEMVGGDVGGGEGDGLRAS